MHTQDIPTDPATAPKLHTLDDLKQAVHGLASRALILKAAAAEEQLKIEAAKKAYADATAEITAEHNQLLGSIQAYCEANKDMLFPLRKGKRSKTFQILGHELKYRAVSHITAPEDVLIRIKSLVARLEHEAAGGHLTAAEEANLMSTASALRGLIRTKEELNKDAAKTLLTARPEAMLPIGIINIVTDDFSVVINPTPGAN